MCDSGIYTWDSAIVYVSKLGSPARTVEQFFLYSVVTYLHVCKHNPHNKHLSSGPRTVQLGSDQ